MSTVLVVEDDQLLRDMLRAVLEPAGPKMLEAADADHALELCRIHRGPIDTLLCDLGA